MEIVVAASAGFCFGVKRALLLARQTLVRARALDGSASVFTLGPLVHNPRVVEQLRSEGIAPLEDPSESRGRPIVIRTHGIAPDALAKVTAMGFDVVDATCPLVKKIHAVVSEMREERFRLAIIGHAEHPEVKGILGCAGPDAVVVQSLDEARALPFSEKLGAVVQTTFIDARFQEISEALGERAREYRVCNTICQATTDRQRSTSELAERADIVVVVGSRVSSNTLRLAETCAEKGAVTYLVESAGEVRSSWLEGASVVGVTAGASTPQELIDEVCEALRRSS